MSEVAAVSAAEAGTSAKSASWHLIRGTKWQVALRWSVRLTGVMSTIVLARLLTPADYGVVAIATIILGGIEIFSQLGLYTAVIRHTRPKREHSDSIWILYFFIDLVLVLFFLASKLLMNLYI